MQVPLAFPSSHRITLDGVLVVPDGLSPPFSSVALCHPHPILGGHKEQPLVYLTARALERQGIASLRFNFRGVGDSQGEFSMGKHEVDDVLAAVKLLRLWRGLDHGRVGLMGYSFGATLALQATVRTKHVRGLALVAPPTNSFPASPYRRWKRRTLLVGGANDLIASSEELQRLAAAKPGLAQCRVIPGTDHALAGHEGAVAALVAEFFAETFAKM